MRYEKEGCIFEIWTEEVKDGYYAHWACQCGDVGESNHLDSSEDAALLAAKVHASSHHGLKHKKKDT